MIEGCCLVFSKRVRGQQRVSMFSTNISHGYDGTHKFEFWKLIRKTNAKEKNEESSPATLIAKKITRGQSN